MQLVLQRQNSTTVHNNTTCWYRHWRCCHRHYATKKADTSTTIQDPSIQSPIVPIIDMSLSEEEIGYSIHQACTTVGFFIVIRHGVSQELCSRILHQARLLFSVLSPQDKEAISVKHSNSYRGYQSMGVNVTNGQPDGHEALDLISESVKANVVRGRQESLLLSSSSSTMLTNYGKNQWPDPNLLPNFRSTTEEYIHAMQTLGQRLMGACSRGLGLDPKFFEPYFDDAYWTMRMIRYPASQHNDNVKEDYDFGVGK
jgi:isopenicillin N synthase-like dioxygenase